MATAREEPEAGSSELLLVKEFDVSAQGYRVRRIVGHGSFGTVASAVHEPTEKKVAIKKLTGIFDHGVRDSRRAVREIHFLKLFDHVNIIKLLDVLEPPSWDPDEMRELYLVLEYMQSDLARVCRSTTTLGKDHVGYIGYQILCGLQYMHSANVFHRDLKPSNILVNSSCKIKIADFGLARGLHEGVETPSAEQLTEYVVTRWYRAPEILLCHKTYDYAVDMWSLGCILVELFTRKALFKGSNHLEQLDLILNTFGIPESIDLSDPDVKAFVTSRAYPPEKKCLDWSMYIPGAPEELVDLVSKLLVFDPSARLTASEALRHPFFKKFYVESFVRQTSIAITKFDYEFEKLTRTKDSIADLIFREVLYFRPGVLQEKFKTEKRLKKKKFHRRAFTFSEGRRRSII
jgi:mitogen-activated protein kinase 1/3